MIVSVIYPDNAKPGDKFYVEEIDVDAARSKVKIWYETLRPSIAEQDWEDAVVRLTAAVDSFLDVSGDTPGQGHLAYQALYRARRAMPPRPRFAA